MDSAATIGSLKDLVKDFCEARDWDQFHSAKELAIGVSTEAGELLDKFRFLSEQQISELLASNKRMEVEHELADVMFFLLRFAQRFDIDIETTLRDKMAVNEQKYPVEKSRGRNEKSTEL